MVRKIELYLNFFPCGCWLGRSCGAEGVEMLPDGSYLLRGLTPGAVRWMREERAGHHAGAEECRVMAVIRGQSYRISKIEGVRR